MTDGLSPAAPPRLFGAGWMLGAVQAQRWMWSEAFCHWTRRPLPSALYARKLGDGQRFALNRGAWMSVLVPMVVFSQFVDVLLCQAALQFAIADVAARWALHILLLFVSVWTVVWAVALRSAVRHVDHVLDAHALTLAIGFKQLCRIPLAAIAGAQVIDHKVRRTGDDWHDVHQLKPREVTLLTALDKPTLLIELRADANGAWWTRNGARKPLRRHVAVYVDQPTAMATAISALLTTSALPGA